MKELSFIKTKSGLIIKQRNSDNQVSEAMIPAEKMSYEIFISKIKEFFN